MTIRVAHACLQVSAEESVASVLAAAGAVPALLHVISKNMANAKAGKSKLKRSKHAFLLDSHS